MKPNRETSLQECVNRAYCEHPDIGRVATVLATEGPEGLDKLVLTPGVPVKPMLAQAAKSIDEVLERYTECDVFTTEYKYDGERAQIHRLPDGSIKVYSRNLEDVSARYTDMQESLCEAASNVLSYVHGLKSSQRKKAQGPFVGTEAEEKKTKAKKGMVIDDDDESSEEDETEGMAVDTAEGTEDGPKDGTFIIDGECVAYDPVNNKILPFQALTRRVRKEDDPEAPKEADNVKVAIYAFDVLYLNGHSLLQTDLGERRELLHEHFQEKTGVFFYAQYRDMTADSDLMSFLTEAVNNNTEGLMVKVLSGAGATYEPSKRSMKWSKLKKDYMEGMGDSFDLIPIGAWEGNGKRRGKYGAYLLACYNPNTETFQTTCKVGTGFSDELLVELTSRLKGKVVDSKPADYDVSDTFTPDVWFSAEEVWEIRIADLQMSPTHTSAKGEIRGDARGIGLRFPRMLRVRHDKKVEEGTDSNQVVRCYMKQPSVSGNSSVAKAGGDEDDDFF
ncbi:DNA ligase, ATP-dependent [Kipferlia bialata]|uniref:DNA ligase n=1 Tax=Kipferlia bialata TaxID=797122 RepID=A0A9K3CS84_9EUKA|nr:DNA ligase, ATP-dependent [Kipferlia bialata]|eukprot:g2452.t1